MNRDREGADRGLQSPTVPNHHTNTTNPAQKTSDTPDVQTPFSVLTWEFPILAKYRWTTRRWAPIIYNPSHFGITAGAGLEARTHGILISPTLPYTRWLKDPPLFKRPPEYHLDYPRTNANELLLRAAF